MYTFKNNVLLLLVMLIFQLTKAESLPAIYLLPGQGADHRLFNNLDLRGDFEIKHIKYFTPEISTSLEDYARQLSNQIDTTQKFILIGVSLGGMIATEMSTFLNPEKVIIISSAKGRNELPLRYRFQKRLPIYKLFREKTIKRGAMIMQPLVESDRNNEKEIFTAMLKAKDPLFLRRTVDMIVNWKRENFYKNIIHIHGTSDNTIPIRNVNYDHRIEKGSHLMTLTRGKEISELIDEILKFD